MASKFAILIEMKTQIFLLATVFFFLLTGCGSEVASGDPIFDKNLKLSERIRLALEKSYLEELGVDEENAGAIAQFYEARGYRPVWANDSMLTATGQTMEQILSKPNCIGIPDNRWEKKADQQKELISKELLMTAQLGFAFGDLKNGMLDTARHTFKPLLWTGEKHWDRQVDTVTNWGSWFAGFGTFHTDYQRIAKGLFNYAFNHGFSKNTFDIPKLKQDSAGCYRETRLSLIDKGYLDKNAPDSAFAYALDSFQIDNGLKPDGVIGNYTRLALEESAQHKVDRAILSLERWRWRSKFPDRYVWINIPEYMLRLYYNDTLQSEHRVVVGKTDTKTPQLESRIRSIIAYPYWTVPYSITSKEILPELKRNPGYLAKHNYKLFKNGEEIDPYSVNWKRIPENTFPYKVRQEPGKGNSLGIIKFEFSNPYGVYLHDTPSKGLFGTDIRSYSHGCIRCNLPDSLARFILRRDEQRIIPDSLDSMLFKQQHRTISLKHPVTIKVDYITVTADATNKLTFHPDIYKRDSVYLKWISKD